MSIKPSLNQQSLRYIAGKQNRQKGQHVPEDLQKAINDCSTMEHLLELLFTCPIVKNEAIMAAFDQRIDELEATC